MKVRRLSYIFSFLSILVSCKGDDAPVSNEPAEELTTTIAYKFVDGVEQDLLSLDVYHDSEVEVEKPVVVWVHGGGWAIGDKANQLTDKVTLIRSLNYLLVSVNYRLSPFPYEPDNPDRVRFPMHNEDVADAIKWVHDHIANYGGDTEKIALLGHSAGAHLVAITGTNGDFLETVGLNLSAIRGVAAIDTEGYDVASEVQSGNELYINAFGTDEEENSLASPIAHVVSTMAYPKFFIAKRGSTERLAVANAFIETLENNGVEVSQINGSVYNHAGINEAIGAPGETIITEPLIAFFAECFE